MGKLELEKNVEKWRALKNRMILNLFQDWAIALKMNKADINNLKKF